MGAGMGRGMRQGMGRGMPSAEERAAFHKEPRSTPTAC
jgi:hypothetical protein